MLLVRDCSVLAGDGRSERLDLLISEGEIVAIGDGLDDDGATVVEARGLLALPGLVNAHLHSSEAPLRGSYDRLPFDAWGLFIYPPFRPGSLPTRLVYLRTVLVAIESLRAGVTCVVDDVADETLSLDVLEQVFAAYRDVGLRCSCSGHVMDREPLGRLPFADEVLTASERARLDELTFPEPREYREFAEEAISRFHNPTGLARFVVAPVAPQWCSEEMLDTCVDIATTHGLNLLMHVLETKEQALTSARWGDGGFVEYLRRHGALRSGTTIAHGVWLQESELDVLAETGCSVAHNPVANLRLGVGIAPVGRMVERGIPVGLGTDGLAINDRADLFEVMRTAALLSRQVSPSPSDWLGARDVLDAATAGGARCAHLEGAGVIRVGGDPDIVLLRLVCEPLSEREMATSVVFSCGPENVDTVIVGGRIAFRDGEVLGVNEEEIRGELAEYVPLLRGWQQDVEARNGELKASLEEIHLRSAAAPL